MVHVLEVLVVLNGCDPFGMEVKVVTILGHLPIVGRNCDLQYFSRIGVEYVWAIGYDLPVN